jgi:lipid-A-disaccharide synthase
MTSAPRIFLSAGEASGEQYGAQLVAALLAREPHAECFGLGGSRMEQLGFRRIVKAEDVAVMGITEVVRHMPRIYAEFRKLRASLRRERPDVAILIDFPDVNLRLAEELHRLGVPVIYFVSPQLWAWKKRRIERVKKYVTRMLVIFPFEVEFYRGHGVQADFVGHPLTDLPLPASQREQYARENSLDPAKQWIGLLPGSRRQQVKLNLPEMLRSARQLAQQGDYEFLLPVAPTLQRSFVEQVITQHESEDLPVHLVDDARSALFHARAAIVSSGTATVDAALIGNPFVVVYRLSRTSYAVASRVVDVPHVAMVNLVAGRRLVPELIQHDFIAVKVVEQLKPLLADGEARSAMQKGLVAVRASLERVGTSSCGVASQNGAAASTPTAIEAVAEMALSYTLSTKAASIGSKTTPGRPVSVP